MEPWLEIAWEDQGIREIVGAEAEPAIIQFFKDAGHPEIVSDEVSWCAAFIASCLERAGLPIPIPREDRLLARSYQHVGTPIDRPRVGAIAVLWRDRPDSWKGHVGFVVGETETTVALLGGNQANSVNVTHYDKERVLGYRWPAPAKGVGEVGGSRTDEAGKQVIKDAGKAAGSGGSGWLVDTSWVPDLSSIANDAGQLKTVVNQLHDFLIFTADKWPLIAAVGVVYFLGRIGWNGLNVRLFRTQDENEGRHEAHV